MNLRKRADFGDLVAFLSVEFSRYITENEIEIPGGAFIIFQVEGEEEFK